MGVRSARLTLSSQVALMTPRNIPAFVQAAIAALRKNRPVQETALRKPAKETRPDD